MPSAPRVLHVWPAALLLGGACAAPPPEVTVFVASSAREAVEVLSSERANVRINTAATSALVQQIRRGARADIFVSADRAWVEELVQEQRVAEQRPVAANSLVVIAASGAPKTEALAALQRARHVAMADPRHVPAGRYTQRALEHLGLWSTLKTRSTSSANVRAALALVESGIATVGVVYATDAQHAQVRVLGQLPLAPHDEAQLIAVRLNTQNTTADRLFAELVGPEGHAAFTKLGFKSP